MGRKPAIGIGTGMEGIGTGMEGGEEGTHDVAGPIFQLAKDVDAETRQASRG
jgi:hypothetical protein